VAGRSAAWLDRNVGDTTRMCRRLGALALFQLTRKRPQYVP